MTGENRRRMPDGKCAFDNIYDQGDPDAYFTALKPLQYQAPHHAQPIFRRAARALARLRGVQSIELLDLCCGYGVNAALLNYAVSMDDLYRRFRLSRHARGTRESRLESDEKFFDQRRIERRYARVTGVDTAGNALAYARAVGLLDHTVQLNLEADPIDEQAAERLIAAHMITVTGGFSYIGARSIGRLLKLYPEHRRPWILALPLRNTDFSACELAFERFGLQSEAWTRWPVPHRRFGDSKERASVLHVDDPDSDIVDRPQSHTHLEAVLHVARTEPDIARCELADIVSPSTASKSYVEGAVSFA